MNEQIQPGAMLLIAPDNLAALIEGAVEKKIREYSEEKLRDKYLTTEQMIDQVFGGQVSKSTIYEWVGKGYLQKHTIGGRTFFKYGEVMEAGKTLKKYQRHTS